MIIIDNISKVFMMSDLHFGARNNALVWRDDQIGFIDYFIDDARKRGLNEETDVLFILGDVFDSRESINMMIATHVMGAFKKLSKVFKRGIYIILGNHDVYYADNNEVYSPLLLSLISDNIHILKDHYTCIINGKHSCLMLPWVTDPAAAAELITRNSKDCDYVFAHLDINEMFYESGLKISKGVDPSIFDSYKAVYSGHIHQPQHYKNILYLGSPYHLERSDIGHVNGYYIIDTAIGMTEAEFVENTNSPRFVECNADEIFNKDIDTVSKLFSNNYIDINIRKEMERHLDVKNFIKFLRDSKIRYKKVGFDPYSDSVPTVIDFKLTKDFNLVDIGVAILKDKKYNDAEIDEVVNDFQSLYKKTKAKYEE